MCAVHTERLGSLCRDDDAAPAIDLVHPIQSLHQSCVLPLVGRCEQSALHARCRYDLRECHTGFFVPEPWTINLPQRCTGLPDDLQRAVGRFG